MRPKGRCRRARARRDPLFAEKNDAISASVMEATGTTERSFDTSPTPVRREEFIQGVSVQDWERIEAREAQNRAVEHLASNCRKVGCLKCRWASRAAHQRFFDTVFEP